MTTRLATFARIARDLAGLSGAILTVAAKVCGIAIFCLGPIGIIAGAGAIMGKL